MSKDQKKALKTSNGLRHYLAACVANNPGAEIAGCSLEEWVKLHSRMTVKAYQKKQLAAGCWGGDIEIAACAVSWGVNVWVWRPTRDSFELTCRFTSPKSSRHVLHLLYREGTHYDVFRPDADELKAALAEAGALPLTPTPALTLTLILTLTLTPTLTLALPLAGVGCHAGPVRGGQDG